MDINTCFDKLWLQACINLVCEAVITNEKLNLFYIANKNAQIANKVNNKLSTRINVQAVIMQGSTWGSLKCTTTLDTGNKLTLEDETLHYNYKGDKNIPIELLGMVDDTLAVTQCGNASVKRNAFANSLAESQRLTLSTVKSVVVHIGNVKNCDQTCPELKVPKESMKKSESTWYLGNMIS